MSKKPLVEDYQQQTPYTAEAIARAIALQDAEDTMIGLETGAGNKHQLSEAGTQLP
jgi:hypothetical protein